MTIKEILSGIWYLIWSWFNKHFHKEKEPQTYDEWYKRECKKPYTHIYSEVFD